MIMVNITTMGIAANEPIFLSLAKNKEHYNV